MGRRATFFPVGLGTKPMFYWKRAFDVEGGEEGLGGRSREFVISSFSLTCGQRGHSTLHPGCWGEVP